MLNCTVFGTRLFNLFNLDQNDNYVWKLAKAMANRGISRMNFDKKTTLNGIQPRMKDWWMTTFNGSIHHVLNRASNIMRYWHASYIAHHSSCIMWDVCTMWWLCHVALWHVCTLWRHCHVTGSNLTTNRHWCEEKWRERWVMIIWFICVTLLRI